MYAMNEVEEAEFNYRLASFYYQIYKPLLAIDYIRIAKDIFSKQTGYKINVALCDNVFGLACIDLRQFEQAEESFNTAIDILKVKMKEHCYYVLEITSDYYMQIKIYPL